MMVAACEIEGRREKKSRDRAAHDNPLLKFSRIIASQRPPENQAPERCRRAEGQGQRRRSQEV
jgi:hypothetical protein